MTIPLIKIKVFRKSVVKARMDVRFPAKVAVQNFLTVARSNGTYTFGVDYTQLTDIPIIDPTTSMVAVFDQTAGIYKLQKLSELIASTTQIEQHVTAAGPVTVLNNAGIVRVDQTVGAAMTLNLPPAANKTCPVLVADWKNDASTNNITVVPNGSEKIQGQSSWVIGGDGGSIFLRPIAGVGYVL